MNFLEFRDAKDFLNSTGLSIEQGLLVCEAELKRLKKGSDP